MDIRILIADRQEMFREALKRLFNSQRDLVVIGESNDGDELLRLASDLKPDVLLLDYYLRRRSGLQVLRDVATNQPEVRPVVIADAMDSREIACALLLGARGVLRRDSPVDLLFKCIRSVMAGECWVSRHEIVELVQNLRMMNDQMAQSEGKETNTLSSRELQIVEAIESGCTNREIAQELRLSERTVKYHLTNIFSKCGVAGRMELARHSLKNKRARRA